MTDQGSQQSLRVFCSYSHKDKPHLQKLRAHLAGLERERLITGWHDLKILPGEEWEEAIAENLRTAEIIILLVSPEFMFSDFIAEKELKQALARHDRGEARVVPVIVRPTEWQSAPFGKLHVLPEGARPITLWSNRDKAWLSVAQGIRKVVCELSTGREQTAKERYCHAVAELWMDNKLDGAVAGRLRALAGELGLGGAPAAEVERKVIGDTIEGFLGRQTGEREEDERRNRLEELYAEARRAHQTQDWQAVADLFDQKRAVDPQYPDPEGLLASALDQLGDQDDSPGEAHRPSRSAWEYIDLDLEIWQGDGSNYPVVVRSTEGEEVREEMQLPFRGRDLERKLDDVEKAVLLSGTKRRRISLPEREIVQDFGEALFQALLGGKVGAYYNESLRKARRQEKGLRLKLRIHPPELVPLPWEFLYDPARSAYLSLSSKTPLVRHVALNEPVEQVSVAPPLRILGMVASPQNLPKLEVDKEKRRVEEAIGDLEAKGRVELTWLEGQTSRHLLRAMRRGPWHVFHFIGHGGVLPNSEEGLIALADEEGSARFLRADTLAELLRDHWDLRLVLLNSCEGARSREHYAFSSTAAALVRPGIPAVVANQYDISDEAAVEFSRAFYEAVADGLPLDAAVAGARTSIKVEIDNSLEWGTPVLYLQSPDGQVFDIQKEETKEDEDSPSRYRECVESAWADEELHEREVEWLRDYASDTLRLSPNTAARIEREVMGYPKEVVFERQTHEREAEERRNHLDELYAEARRSHQAQDWQAVLDNLDRIRSEDSAYPNAEELAVSSREALAARERTRRADDLYDQGLRHHDTGEWSEAVECFEEVQKLEPGYRQVDELLLQLRGELTDPTDQGHLAHPRSLEPRRGGKGSSPKPDRLPSDQSVQPRSLPGDQRPKPGHLPGKPKSRPDFLPSEQGPTRGRPSSLPD